MQGALGESDSKGQGRWHDASVGPVFSEYLELDLSTVVASIAGPKRPQDRISLTDAKASFRGTLKAYVVDDDKASISSNVDEAGQDSFPASEASEHTPNGLSAEQL